MTSERFEDAERAAQVWLNRHVDEFHTHRAYTREYRRLLVWSLDRGTAPQDLSDADLAAYFEDYEHGRISTRVSEEPALIPSPRTLERARSILRQLFWHFASEHLCTGNPLVRPTERRPALARNKSDELNVPSWRTCRARWLRKTEGSTKERDPIVRSVTIAELAYWSGMRSSELAAARMSDVHVIGGKTYIDVRRFGGEPIETVLLPEPAVSALHVDLHTELSQFS
jgi:site-specific recombinase XerD